LEIGRNKTHCLENSLGRGYESVTKQMRNDYGDDDNNNNNNNNNNNDNLF